MEGFIVDLFIDLFKRVFESKIPILRFYQKGSKKTRRQIYLPPYTYGTVSNDSYRTAIANKKEVHSSLMLSP